MKLEILSRAFSGQLTYDADHERDLDRLIAMCLGNVTSDRRGSREAHLNALGVSLIAFKARNLPTYHDRAQEGLSAALRWRTKALGAGRRLRIAGLAIQEWAVDMCPTCLGSAMVSDMNGVQSACVVCSGSGKRRYSDGERSVILAEPASKYSSAISIAHGIIALAVDIANKQAERMLSP